MAWLIYCVCLILTLGKVIIKSFKALKSSVDDTTIQSRDLLICWTVYLLIFGWEVSGMEILFRWIPGYYYGKSSCLLFVAFPQLRLARIIFFEFIKPWMDYIDQYLLDLGINSPIQALEAAPFLLLALLFPGVNFEKSSVDVSRRRSDSEAYNFMVKSKLTNTSKKLSILTEYLDELELRSSNVKKDSSPSNSSKKTSIQNDNGDNINTNNSDVWAKLNIFDKFKKSPEKKRESNPQSPSSSPYLSHDQFISPRHNRRRSLEVLQQILEKQASSTLQFFGIDQQKYGPRSDFSNNNNNNNGNEVRNRSNSRSGSNSRSSRPSSRNASMTRRPSKENILLMDPVVMSGNITARRRVRTVKTSPFITEPSLSIFRAPTQLSRESSGTSSHSENSPVGNRFLKSARESLGKDMDNILKGFRRPSTRSSIKLEASDSFAKAEQKNDIFDARISNNVIEPAESKTDSRRYSPRLSMKDDGRVSSKRYTTPPRK